MVKMKKTFLITILLVAMMSFAQTTLATVERVFDQASLFTQAEVDSIRETVDSLSEQLEIDIVIVTTNDSEGKTSKQYADDFYDQNGYMYDGILYLLNMDEREVYISTTGYVRDIITDWDVEEILDEVYYYLADEQYRDSVAVFLAEVEARMTSSTEIINENDGVAQVPSDVGNYDEEGSFLQEALIYLAVSLVVGGVTVGIMAMYNRGRLTVNEATYLDRESFKITRKVDRHYNTIVTKQKIQKNNSTGGGSSFRGGGGHGGGGRKF